MSNQGTEKTNFLIEAYHELVTGGMAQFWKAIRYIEPKILMTRAIGPDCQGFATLLCFLFMYQDVSI